MSPAQGGAEDSVRLLLIKNPTRSFCTWGQVHRTIPAAAARYQAPPSVLTLASSLFQRGVGSSSGVTPLLVYLHNHV